MNAWFYSVEMAFITLIILLHVGISHQISKVTFAFELAIIKVNKQAFVGLLFILPAYLLFHP